MNIQSILKLSVPALLCVCIVANLRITVAYAIEPVYIRANGEVDPENAPIRREGDSYILEADIESNTDGIVVERDDIRVNGGGHTIGGLKTQHSRGLDLSRRNNVTIENLKITRFYAGIWMSDSFRNNVSGTTIYDAEDGLYIVHSESTLLNNNSITECQNGIYVAHSSSSTISGCLLTSNAECGIRLSYSTENRISENCLKDNGIGISLSYSSENSIEGNVFVNDGLLVQESSGNTVIGNSVNGKPLVYLENASDSALSYAGQVILVNCQRISVSNVVISNATIGIQLFGTNESDITHNTLTANQNCAIGLYNSSGNRISGNDLTSNNIAGVWIDSSSHNHVIENNMADNGVAVWIDWSSNNNVAKNQLSANEFGIRLHGVSNMNFMSENNLTDNLVGIRFQSSSHNKLSHNNMTNNHRAIELESLSNNNSIVENTILNNGYGIWLESCSENRIFHNNFLDDNPQVYVESSANGTSWDDGYPSGGNYWRYYEGNDSYSGSDQSEIGSDGIGDSPRTIDLYNIDKYPLTAPLLTIRADFDNESLSVGVSTNSTFKSLEVDKIQKTVSLVVKGNEGLGFCRITLPKTIVQEFWENSYAVLLNGTAVLFRNWTDQTITCVYVNYAHSELQITLIDEFSSMLILPLAAGAILLARTICFFDSSHRKSRSRQ